MRFEEQVLSFNSIKTEFQEDKQKAMADKNNYFQCSGKAEEGLYTQMRIC